MQRPCASLLVNTAAAEIAEEHAKMRADGIDAQPARPCRPLFLDIGQTGLRGQGAVNPEGGGRSSVRPGLKGQQPSK
jgi:hypothetical protein